MSIYKTIILCSDLLKNYFNIWHHDNLPAVQFDSSSPPAQSFSPLHISSGRMHTVGSEVQLLDPYLHSEVETGHRATLTLTLKFADILTKMQQI